jgi:prolyl oligopeptidase
LARPDSASRFDYPPTRRDDTVDVLHGVRVHDPYRWLEGDGPEAMAFALEEFKRAL